MGRWHWPESQYREDKFMAINYTNPFSLTVNLEQLDQANSLTYLGSQLCTDGSSEPIFNSDCRKHRRSLHSSENHCGTGVKLVYQLKFGSTWLWFEQSSFMNATLGQQNLRKYTRVKSSCNIFSLTLNIQESIYCIFRNIYLYIVYSGKFNKYPQD